MKTMWKGVSRFDDGGDGLLIITVRQDYEMVVNRKQIASFLSELHNLTEQKAIPEQTAQYWEAEFAAITALISQLQESPAPIKRASLETPWQEWPSETINDVLPALKDAFGKGSFFMLNGTLPNYNMVYHLGSTVKEFSLRPDDLEPTKALFANITEQKLLTASALVRTQNMSAKEAAIAVGIVAAGTVVTVGAAYGLAAGIGAVAAGAVTAAEVANFAIGVATVVGAAASAYSCQMQQDQAQRDRDKQKAEEAKTEKDKNDAKAREVKDISGGDTERAERWARAGALQ